MAPARKYLWGLLALFLAVGGLWGGSLAAGLEPRLGLDLQGGISVVLSPTEGANVEALEKAVDIIRNRVDALGVAEPEIARQGNDILVQLPGIKEQKRALQLIGTTAKLRFRPVLGQISPGSAEYAGTKPGDCGKSTTFPKDDPAREVVLCAKEVSPEGQELPPESWPKLALGPAALEGEDVSDARATLDPQGVQGWFVELDLSGDGAKKFKTITGTLACRRGQGVQDQLAIVLDRVVESHPQMGEGVNCNDGIGGGTAQITGNFSEAEAKDLALVLRYGALPVTLEAISTTSVSPTLGRDSLRGGLLAGAIGLAIVFSYVVLFYRVLGFVIWAGLLMHGLLTLGVIILLGETAGFALTLAGIAGLIVSLGIATDSFIVYFERIKDEAREGRPVRAAVDRGWTSARRTIVAADIVTALAAVILYLLAVGAVRGFALMLGLSTALDLFISYLFMHPLVWFLAKTRGLERALGGRRRAAEPVPVPGGGS